MAEKLSEFSALDLLETRTKASWPNIRFARFQSGVTKTLLEDTLGGFTSSDSSIVVVGSLARQEFTSGSDVDWTLLLDGISHPEHIKVAHEIRKSLKDLDIRQPGREGVFGTIASGHDLIHNIGGQDDTNANTTLRILLLLESDTIGHSDAYERVLRNVLWRYLDEDRGLWLGSGEYKVPRFLFNDMARYWRTMTVDFAYKQRNRQNEGFAIRNLKLRMSRKLLFLAGMVACFECHCGFASTEERREFYSIKQVQAVIERLRLVLMKPPLEILASALLRDPNLDLQSKQLFDSYDEFLGMLADDTPSCGGQTIREHLDKLPVERLGSDETASRGRDISHRYRDAIGAIFLSDKNELGRMTIEYGVF
ncbi:nucleotidyltransferase domain-containing protein [Granulicella sp. S190]|uniref:nucleotidyltransferase domain-containing protein n=1 Tax=Granulicella sp. S190 TaxID=1747226 RepID=UPI00131CC706|nr:nucleotidyltransferase domain-containing protein [Granulicella sp. S190]